MTKDEKNKLSKQLFEKAVGYGLDHDGISVCINSIPDDFLEDFMYTLQRIAEKSGHENITLNYID